MAQTDLEVEIQTITAYAKSIFKDTESVVRTFQESSTPQYEDSPEKLSKRLLLINSTSTELADLYREAATLKNEVDGRLSKYKTLLKDEEMEAIEKPNFRPLGGYMSSKAEELKLRSITFETKKIVEDLENLRTDLLYLVDVVKSYQFDVRREWQSIEIRIKLDQLW